MGEDGAEDRLKPTLRRGVFAAAMAKAWTFLALVALLAGCGQFPRDAEESLEKARRGEPIVVGYALAEPWVRAGPTGPGGVEPDLVRAWANDAGVTLRWVRGSESQLVEALHQGLIHVAVAGFTDATPHGTRIGLTQPYLKSDIFVGAAPGTPVPPSWQDVPIGYDQRRPEFAAAIRKAGGIPRAAPPGERAALAAAYAEELGPLGLSPAGKRIKRERRVIATAPAENALTLSLDRFLHRHRAAIAARVGAEAAR